MTGMSTKNKHEIRASRNSSGPYPIRSTLISLIEREIHIHRPFQAANLELGLRKA